MAPVDERVDSCSQEAPTHMSTNDNQAATAHVADQEPAKGPRLPKCVDDHKFVLDEATGNTSFLCSGEVLAICNKNSVIIYRHPVWQEAVDFTAAAEREQHRHVPQATPADLHMFDPATR